MKSLSTGSSQQELHATQQEPVKSTTMPTLEVPDTIWWYSLQLGQWTCYISTETRGVVLSW